MTLRSTDLAILDNQSLFRRTLINFLSNKGIFNVTIEAADVFDLIDKLPRASVDVLLLEVFSLEMKGDDAVKMIREKYPAIKILLLSASMDIHLISDMVDAGIHGYISKSDEPEELLRAIQTVKENRIYRNKLLTEALYFNKQNAIVVYRDKPAASLGDRERKILQLLWEEKNNKEIANQLFLGIRTVERIRQDMKEKVGARSTIGLIKFAILNNIITDMPAGNRHVDASYAENGVGPDKTTFTGV